MNQNSTQKQPKNSNGKSGRRLFFHVGTPLPLHLFLNIETGCDASLISKAKPDYTNFYIFIGHFDTIYNDRFTDSKKCN